MTNSVVFEVAHRDHFHIDIKVLSLSTFGLLLGFGSELLGEVRRLIKHFECWRRDDRGRQWQVERDPAVFLWI